MAAAQSDSTERIAALSQQSSNLTAAYVKNPNDRAARVKARTAARELLLSLQDGDDGLFFTFEHLTAASVLRYLLHINALEVIPLTGSIPATELAAKLGCERSFIVRLMRMVVANGLFDEPEVEAYAHTRRSVIYLDRGYRHTHEIFMDDFIAGGAWPHFIEYFDKNEKKAPDDPTQHPYGSAFGMPGKDWHEVMARDPVLLQKIFLMFTAKWSTAPTLGLYPFEKLETASADAEKKGSVFMVDVGGSIGNTMKEIREAYPQLKGRIVSQDQPPVIAGVPAGFLPASIEPMVHDFWTPQPVQGAKVYYFKRIMHDWPDAHCIKILKHQADAMLDDSIVLVTDYVLPEKVALEDTFAYTLDMCMFMFGGKERTKADWEGLFEAAGLELVKIWLVSGSNYGVVEGRKRRA